MLLISVRGSQIHGKQNYDISLFTHDRLRLAEIYINFMIIISIICLLLILSCFRSFPHFFKKLKSPDYRGLCLSMCIHECNNYGSFQEKMVVDLIRSYV